MQASIDSAKRRFDIDISTEIKRIKNDMDIKKHGYPVFWSIIKRDFNTKLINKNLICPMNELCNTQIPIFRDTRSTLPMSHFFEKYEISKNDTKYRSVRVEELITQYSLNIYNELDKEHDTYLLLRHDFDDLIADIKKIKLSHNYVGLFSWLIDRAFCISTGAKINKHALTSTTHENKSILLKVLFKINSQNLLQVFSKNC